MEFGTFRAAVSGALLSLVPETTQVIQVRRFINRRVPYLQGCWQGGDNPTAVATSLHVNEWRNATLEALRG